MKPKEKMPLMFIKRFAMTLFINLISKILVRAINSEGDTLNKNDLVAKVAETSELSKADATKAVDAVFETITSTLAGGDEIRLVGFGTFAVSQRAATKGRNPRTGEEIDIPASKQPKFKAGKGLKDAVNA